MGLPGDVARSWDWPGWRCPTATCRSWAFGLLRELEERRRVILTSRTVAPDQRTYDSVAAEFDVGRERVRQLEISALVPWPRYRR